MLCLRVFCCCRGSPCAREGYSLLVERVRRSPASLPQTPRPSVSLTLYLDTGSFTPRYRFALFLLGPRRYITKFRMLIPPRADGVQRLRGRAVHGAMTVGTAAFVFGDCRLGTGSNGAVIRGTMPGRKTSLPPQDEFLLPVLVDTRLLNGGQERATPASTGRAAMLTSRVRRVSRGLTFDRRPRWSSGDGRDTCPEVCRRVASR